MLKHEGRDDEQDEKRESLFVGMQNGHQNPQQVGTGDGRDNSHGADEAEIDAEIFFAVVFFDERGVAGRNAAVSHADQTVCDEEKNGEVGHERQTGQQDARSHNAGNRQHGDMSAGSVVKQSENHPADAVGDGQTADGKDSQMSLQASRTGHHGGVADDGKANGHQADSPEVIGKKGSGAEHFNGRKLPLQGNGVRVCG